MAHSPQIHACVHLLLFRCVFHLRAHNSRACAAADPGGTPVVEGAASLEDASDGSSDDGAGGATIAGSKRAGDDDDYLDWDYSYEEGFDANGNPTRTRGAHR